MRVEFMEPASRCTPGGSDTEAGRMLAKLYGTKAKPTVKYPKPKTKTRPTAPEDMPSFVPAGGRADVDYRTGPRREAAVAVPRVGAREEVSHPHWQSPVCRLSATCR